MTHHKWLKKRHRDNQTAYENRMRRNASRKGGRTRGMDLDRFIDFTKRNEGQGLLDRILNFGRGIF